MALHRDWQKESGPRSRKRKISLFAYVIQSVTLAVACFSSRATYWRMHYARGAQKPPFSILLNPVRATSHCSTIANGKTPRRLLAQKPTLFSRDMSTSRSRIPPIRGYSRVPDAESSSADKSSIFSPVNSPWDHVFEDITTKHPLIPMAREKPRAGLTNRSLEPRRQTMTKGELSAFDDMINMIFFCSE